MQGSAGSFSPKHSPVNWQKEGIWEKEVPAWQHILQPKRSNHKWRAVEVIWQHRLITCTLRQLFLYLLLVIHSVQIRVNLRARRLLTHPLSKEEHLTFLRNLFFNILHGSVLLTSPNLHLWTSINLRAPQPFSYLGCPWNGSDSLC